MGRIQLHYYDLHLYLYFNLYLYLCLYLSLLCFTDSGRCEKILAVGSLWEGSSCIIRTTSSDESQFATSIAPATFATLLHCYICYIVQSTLSDCPRIRYSTAKTSSHQLCSEIWPSLSIGMDHSFSSFLCCGKCKNKQYALLSRTHISLDVSW